MVGVNLKRHFELLTSFGCTFQLANLYSFHQRHLRATRMKSERKVWRVSISPSASLRSMRFLSRGEIEHIAAGFAAAAAASSTSTNIMGIELLLLLLWLIVAQDADGQASMTCFVSMSRSLVSRVCYLHVHTCMTKKSATHRQTVTPIIRIRTYHMII